MKRFAGGATIGIVIVAVIIVGILLSLSSNFFYFFERVDEQEIGVRLQGGSIKDVVGPGVYNDTGLYVRIERISSQAIDYTVSDEEIITKDKQRMGLIVSADIFRPGKNETSLILENWSKYKNIYLNDDLARNRVTNLTRQSMKVCVGDRTFDDNIIGTARDDLRACVDDEVNKLAANFGLRVENLVIPEVILSPQVIEQLDAIVTSRLETEKAAQDKLRADAQADAERAKQEGEIRIAQSRIQEEAKQQTILAQLEQEKILAQKAVIEAERANELALVEAERAIIEAQKGNELLAAEQDIIINKSLAEAAIEKAQADLAPQLALAEILAQNPGYLELQRVQANAEALQNTDKLIFLPEGTIPNLVLSGAGIVPTVDAAPTVPAQ